MLTIAIISKLYKSMESNTENATKSQKKNSLTAFLQLYQNCLSVSFMVYLCSLVVLQDSNSLASSVVQTILLRLQAIYYGILFGIQKYNPHYTIRD